MKPATRALGEIHAAVLLFGVAGLFGKLVSLPAPLVVLGRVVCAAAALGLVAALARRRLALHSRRDGLALLALGALLAAHWTTFFQSIQVSTVAIGLLTFSTFPVFTTFLEPLVSGERLRRADIAIALVAAAGVALIVPRFDLGSDATEGALWGVASGLSFAVLSILNRRYVARYDGIAIAFHQNAAAAVVLLPALALGAPSAGAADVAWLVLLGVVFTAGAHTLFIRGLRHVSARRASVLATLEPVYGIALAALLLDETLSLRTALGGTVIVGAAVLAARDAGAAAAA